MRIWAAKAREREIGQSSVWVTVSLDPINCFDRCSEILSTWKPSEKPCRLQQFWWKSIKYLMTGMHEYLEENNDATEYALMKSE
jgi:hypothetical protein